MKSLLALLAICLLSAHAIGISATSDLDDLERKLKDSDDKVRRTAVTDLAKLGTEEAWSLVFDALEDPKPMVADQAQIELGTTDDAWVVSELLGKRGVKSKSERIQGRVLESLGRSPAEIPAEAFTKALSSKDEDIRLRAAWSVERLARANRLGADPKEKLKKALQRVLAKDKSSNVRAEALSALVAAHPSEARTWISEALVAKATELGVAAIRAAEELPNGDVLDMVLHAKVLNERPARYAAADFLSRNGSAVAASKLIDMLGAEENLRLSWRIVEHLQSLSGRKYGRDVRPWKDWVKDLDATWVATKRSKEREYGEVSTAFVGLPVLSENIALLIDFSGSTWQKREGGVTRKEKLDVEVRRLFETLPETTYFNVIPYTDDPIPWQKELVPASKRNVKKALDFFEGCKQSGKGDFLSAALLALEDPRVDTIMVLTDGAPTGGDHWNLELLVPWFAEKNRYRLVAVDSLLVDAGGKLASYWADLAQRTGGRSITVELK